MEELNAPSFFNYKLNTMTNVYAMILVVVAVVAVNIYYSKYFYDHEE